MTLNHPGEAREDVAVVLCGQAGQGLQTIEHLLTRTLSLAGYRVFSSQEVMSRIRGGINSTVIRIGSKRVAAWVDRIDLLVSFTPGAIAHLRHRISAETVILGDKAIFENESFGERSIDLPFSRLASEAGGPVYLNTVAAAAVAALFKVDWEDFEGYLRLQFSGKEEVVVGKNLEAARAGYAAGDALLKTGAVTFSIGKDPRVKDEILLDGTEAVALGAVAGGCDFVSFYPMSPATGVSTFLAREAKGFGLLVEQAEDEISAVNMALGAWYAGARALVSTSGGGFALMVEGVSLAGMIESPLVVHLAQRPGPATGLPTRTEQGDLFFALHSGHGEFPRILLAPGTLEEAFYLTQKAFDLADRFQVPVFILTDQYLLESHRNASPFEPGRCPPRPFITETGPDYRRYHLTESGLSPRGIPGWGEGLIVVDSDEHDEDGHITEDLDLRTRMVDKRLRKLDLIRAEAVSPELHGSPDYRTLIVGWGSTAPVIREAMEASGRRDVAHLHFSQVYPLHSAAIEFLRRAERVIAVENNATAQFASLIRRETGFEAHKKVLKYNGLPFSVEDMVRAIG
jgi:2-oxoglutarate/2-oxoacid ferredoxin oxidoreductase subunit alpha